MPDRAVDLLDPILPRDAETQTTPDNASAASRNTERIGNVLLLPAPAQRNGHAPSFTEKKASYATHERYSSLEVCQEQEWGLAQIETREARLAEFARSRWADL